MATGGNEQVHAGQSKETGMLTGILHLRKLGLIPETAGKKHSEIEETEEEEDTQRIQAGNVTNSNNPLRSSAQFSYDIDHKNNEGHRNCENCVSTTCNSKAKLNSGKYAKTNVGVIRQELWPHNVVSRKYSKQTSFDNMDYETFIAGEVKIIHSLWLRGDRDMIGRLRVLMLMAHWMCKCRDWSLLRGMFESIMEEIETGECDWGNDFSSYETMIPTATTTMAATVVTATDNKKKTDIYWCKPYQNGTCELVSPHMAIL